MAPTPTNIQERAADDPSAAKGKVLGVRPTLPNENPKNAPIPALSIRVHLLFPHPSSANLNAISPSLNASPAPNPQLTARTAATARTTATTLATHLNTFPIHPNSFPKNNPSGSA